MDAPLASVELASAWPGSDPVDTIQSIYDAGQSFFPLQGAGEALQAVPAEGDLQQDRPRPRLCVPPQG